MPSVVKDSQIQDVPDKEIEYEMVSPARLVGANANVVPMSSNAQSPRLFYSSRFVEQAMPLATRETPLVQSLDPESEEGKSFEQEFGEKMGTVRYNNDVEGTVEEVNDDFIKVRGADGKVYDHPLYNNFQFNRKTYISSKPVVKVGDKVSNGKLLAGSNYTDDEGTMSMGVNARVAMVPYKGHSMDDAIVISEGFANRMRSMHNYQHELQKDDQNKFGKVHYTSLFPTKFTTDQLDTLDDNGMAKPGTVLHKGDPIMLATKPKPVYSNAEHLGRLGKIFRSVRADAAEVWEHDYPGIVTDSVDGKKGFKVFVKAEAPVKVGDKITIRNGQKDIVSLIIPDRQMLRSVDGQPFDVLLNPLALPSRVNTATLYEMMVGKVAKKQGKPIAMPAYVKPGESRLEIVKKMLKDNDLTDTEEVFDPMLNRKLENPVSTGIVYVNKLHHVVESKKSARGNAGYDSTHQPLKGGSEAAQAKRLGGLETTALMAKGAYEILRDSATVRGTSNDAYWRAVRQGYKPAEPGAPYAWEKFRYLLNGAGFNIHDIGKGVLRLAPMTDKDLDEKNPMEVKNGKLVKPDTLEPEEGGLFDSRMIALNKWGKITLPHALPNPAVEAQIATLLRVKVKDLRRVLAGEVDLEDVQAKA